MTHVSPNALSEHRSRQLLKPYGIPLVQSIFVTSLQEAKKAARQLGYPVVIKATGDKLLHKTEMSLVKLALANDDALQEAFEQISNSVPESSYDGMLVQPYIKSPREVITGMKRDDHFGPCVLFGLGGIFAQALDDVVFRVAPLEEKDALAMLDEIRGAEILREVRGEPAVDRQELAKLIVTLGTIGLENDHIEEIDLNPVIFQGPHPVAVDALVVTK